MFYYSDVSLKDRAKDHVALASKPMTILQILLRPKNSIMLQCGDYERFLRFYDGEDLTDGNRGFIFINFPHQ